MYKILIIKRTIGWLLNTSFLPFLFWQVWPELKLLPKASETMDECRGPLVPSQPLQKLPGFTLYLQCCTSPQTLKNAKYISKNILETCGILTTESNSLNMIEDVYTRNKPKRHYFVGVLWLRRKIKQKIVLFFVFPLQTR